MTPSTHPLAASVLAAEPLAIGRALSLVENDGDGALELLDTLYPHTGRARRVGITGPPGVGKSTLTCRLVQELRKGDHTAGILAVDPSSPFTGGALLGDRIRMPEIFSDAGVFLRSMATRGTLGGLARATHQAIDILDAAGKDWILIETVGAGQSEVEISRTADLTLVVLSPEAGDSVQAMKAGLMEIADIIVVNKADRPGADRMKQDLEASIDLRAAGLPHPAVFLTQARTGQGLPELLQAGMAWFERLDAGHREPADRRRTSLRRKLECLLTGHLEDLLRHDPDVRRRLETHIHRLAPAGTSPYRLVPQILRDLFSLDPAPPAE